MFVKHFRDLFWIVGVSTICAVSTASAAELTDLVGGEIKQIMTGCKFNEGPAWHPDGYLLFTDVPNNRIVRVTPDGSHNDWLTDTNGINGLMCDQQGNIYACQGNAKRVIRLQSTDDGRNGAVKAVMAKEFEGQPFNKPNDLALDGEGGLYFTDPNYTRDPPTQPVEGVYYIDKNGKTTRVVDDLLRPNGILVSADGRHLYVANIGERQVVRYRINGPGQLSTGEVIFTAGESIKGGGPDGMSLDEQGNIYATYRSLVVLSPDGEMIDRIEMPEKPANCTFGGADNKTLYLAARTSLYAIPMKVAGIALRATGPSATSNVSTEQNSGSRSEQTREVKAGPLALQVPASWKSEEPSNRLRLAQLSIPAAEGDRENAEIVLSGPFSGGAKANIERWIGQFDASGREVKMSQGETEQGKYIFVDMTGTYNKSIGPPVFRRTQAMPGYRVLNVMFSAESGGNYFFKLAGPNATVEAATEAFRASFGGNVSQESEYTLR